MALVTFRVYAEHLGGTDASTFVGGMGELFYDWDSLFLRIGDGETPGGQIISGGGGGGGNIAMITAGTGINVASQANGTIVTVSLLPGSNTTIGGIKSGNNSSIDANGVLTIDFNTLYAYIDGANTWLQSNDAVTLAAAKAYTDLAEVDLRANDYLTLQVSRAYTDTRETALRANDFITLQVAQSYTDKANTYLQSVIANNKVLVTSNVTSITVGAALKISADFSNPNYQGGIFNITQEGGSFASITNQWTSTASSTKNAYTDFANTIINVSGVNLQALLYAGLWEIQASDDITIGTSVITGANLLSLGISGVGGTYAIPTSDINTADQTGQYINVTANLTANLVSGVPQTLFIDGDNLNNIQPVLFGITGVSGIWNSNTVPFFSTDQTFNWTVGVVGNVVSGILDLTDPYSEALTISGALSGTSTSLDSNTAGPWTLDATYTGTGFYGAGQRTISNFTNSFNQVPTYIPLFYKITNTSANPTFTTSDGYVTHQYIIGDGALTSTNEADYLWIAIPGTSSAPMFKWDAGPFVGITIDPDQTYNDQLIGGQTYQVYGFTGFSQSVLIYTSN